MNKSFRWNKSSGYFECVRCEFKAKSKSDICKHVFAEKKRDGRLTPFDLHRIKKCGENSRICRYCQPEDEIWKEDETASLNYKQRAEEAFGLEIISILLVNEFRYRHKFNEKHRKQLLTASKRKNGLLKMIRNRIEKRIRIYDEDKDGKQTPFLTHGIDVAMHNLAICCKDCLYRWHRIKKSEILTDDEMDKISHFAVDYINDWILNGSESMKVFMSEIQKKSVDEMFYRPGSYVIFKKNDQYHVRLKKSCTQKRRREESIEPHDSKSTPKRRRLE